MYNQKNINFKCVLILMFFLHCVYRIEAQIHTPLLPCENKDLPCNGIPFHRRIELYLDKKTHITGNNFKIEGRIKNHSQIPLRYYNGSKYKDNNAVITTNGEYIGEISKFDLTFSNGTDYALGLVQRFLGEEGIFDNGEKIEFNVDFSQNNLLIVKPLVEWDNSKEIIYTIALKPIIKIIINNLSDLYPDFDPQYHCVIKKYSEYVISLLEKEIFSDGSLDIKDLVLNKKKLQDLIINILFFNNNFQQTLIYKAFSENKLCISTDPKEFIENISELVPGAKVVNFVANLIDNFVFSIIDFANINDQFVYQFDFTDKQPTFSDLKADVSQSSIVFSWKSYDPENDPLNYYIQVKNFSGIVVYETPFDKPINLNNYLLNLDNLNLIGGGGGIYSWTLTAKYKLPYFTTRTFGKDGGSFTIKPQLPENFTAKIIGNDVKLEWNNNFNDYKIFRGLTNNFNDSKLIANSSEEYFYVDFLDKGVFELDKAVYYFIQSCTSARWQSPVCSEISQPIQVSFVKSSCPSIRAKNLECDKDFYTLVLEPIGLQYGQQLLARTDLILKDGTMYATTIKLGASESKILQYFKGNNQIYTINYELSDGDCKNSIEIRNYCANENFNFIVNVDEIKCIDQSTYLSLDYLKASIKDEYIKLKICNNLNECYYVGEFQNLGAITLQPFLRNTNIVNGNYYICIIR